MQYDFSEKKLLRHQQPSGKRSLVNSIILAASGLAIAGGLALFLNKDKTNADMEMLKAMPVAEHFTRDFNKYGTSETIDGMCLAEGLETSRLPTCRELVKELNPDISRRPRNLRAPLEGEIILGPDTNGDGYFGRKDYD